MSNLMTQSRVTLVRVRGSNAYGKVLAFGGIAALCDRYASSAVGAGSCPGAWCKKRAPMRSAGHSLAVLARRMPWEQIEAALAPAFARKDRSGKVVVGDDLFGPSVEIAGAGVSTACRPRPSIRLMASLLYLKHAFNLSDEAVAERWAENVVWQYFSGRRTTSRESPATRSRSGVFAARSVQEKAIAHPVDSRLLEIARAKVVAAAKQAGLSLKQTFAREGGELRRRAGGYGHAKQFRRLRRVVRRQRTILGIVLREVTRKRAVASTDQRLR